MIIGSGVGIFSALIVLARAASSAQEGDTLGAPSITYALAIVGGAVGALVGPFYFS